ncbi:MAG TPA: Plug domain-containing protein [Longimicrobiales bacterium]
MSGPRRPRPRPRPGVVVLGGAVALLLAIASAARAQDPKRRPPPVRPDTLAPRPDSLGVPPDSLPPRDSLAADTLPPVEVVVPFPRGGAPGWSVGVWEWDREALLATAAVTLADLLERIVGTTPIRSGFIGAPEAVGAWGATAGRVDVVLDGFALDPLAGGSPDLSRIELIHLRRVRVERRLGGLRIELETLAPTEHEPYTMIEAGTGDLDAQVFRGLFMAPRVLGSPLAVGIDRIDSDGLRGQEPADRFTAWLKYGIISGSTGLEFELRQSSMERQVVENGVADVREGSRQDWTVRARGAPVPGLTAEGFFGMSAVDGRLTGTDVNAQSAQAGARAAYQGEDAWAAGAVRLRSGAVLPQVEATLSGGARLPARLRVGGDVLLAQWADGPGTVAYGIRSEIGPFAGIRPFVEFSGGERGVPGLPGTGDAPVITDRTAFRAGAEYSRGGLHAGAARVVLRADSLPDFGLPFDGTGRLFPAGELQGWELTGRVPLLWEPLSFEGWYTRWSGANPWIYIPFESWRAALVYHDSPLESGNLEILARLEGYGRGPMATPAPDAGVTAVPARTSFDFYLQIRVMSVRAFLRWENILHRLDLEDLPGRVLPGQRVFYGVKWEFHN